MKLNKLQMPATVPFPVKVAVWGIGGYIVWKWPIKPLFGYLGIVDSAAESDFKKQIKTLANTPTNDGSIRPNITTIQAQEIVNTLIDSMDRFGTDFTKMTNVLKGLSGKDLQLVYATFGVPKYFGTGRGDYFGTAMSLFQWFAAELDSGQLEDMRYLWIRSGMRF